MRKIFHLLTLSWLTRFIGFQLVDWKKNVDDFDRKFFEIYLYPERWYTMDEFNKDLKRLFGKNLEYLYLKIDDENYINSHLIAHYVDSNFYVDLSDIDETYSGVNMALTVDVRALVTLGVDYQHRQKLDYGSFSIKFNSDEEEETEEVHRVMCVSFRNLILAEAGLGYQVCPECKHDHGIYFWEEGIECDGCNFIKPKLRLPSEDPKKMYAIYQEQIAGKEITEIEGATS